MKKIILCLLICLGSIDLVWAKGERLIDEAVIIQNETINEDVYVARGATLFIDGTSKIKGNIYNYGNVIVMPKGNLTLNGSLYTLTYEDYKVNEMKQYQGYDFGIYQNKGQASINKVIMNDNYLDKQLVIDGISYDVVDLNSTKGRSKCQSNIFYDRSVTLGSINTNKDMYILNGANVTFNKDVSIDGDLYIYGTLNNKAKLKVSGNVYCLHYGILNASNDKKGYLYNKGSIKANKIRVNTNYLDKTIPNNSHTYKNLVIEANFKNNGKEVKRCIHCGNTASEKNIYQIKSISLSKTVYEYDGYVKKPSVIIKDSKGKSVASSNYKVTYPTNAKNVGNYQVKVTFKNNYEGEVKLDYQIKRKSISNATISTINDKTYNGYKQSFNISVKVNDRSLTRNKDYIVDFDNSINAGKGKVIVKGIGNYEGSIEKSFTIKPRSISSCEIELVKEYNYSGNKIEPKPRLTYQGIKLEEGKDYQLTYKNNLNVGSGKIIIKGINNFDNNKEVSFKIVANKNKCFTVSGLQSKTYTGSKVKQSLVVKDGSKILKENTDYTLVYKNNINCGVASVRVKGKGNYQGEKIYYYQIKPKATSIESLKSSNSKINIKVNSMKGTAIQYSYRLKGSDNWKHIYSNDNTISITNLNKNKTYEVKVRHYVRMGSNTYFNPYTKIKTIKIK